MPKQLTSNEDLALDLLNFSRFGPMGQVFIMEAIQAYTGLVVEGKVTGPVPGPGWVAIAEDVKARCEAFYSRHDRSTDSEEGEPARVQLA